MLYADPMQTNPITLTQTLRPLEEAHLTTAVRADRDRLAQLLHPHFTETGASGGVHTREDILATLPDQPPQHITLADFSARPLLPNQPPDETSAPLAITTYTTNHAQPDGSIRRVRRTSIWLRSDTGQWRLLHHQGTPITQSMA